MDAIKHFTEGMIKENKPQFEVGDTVRVSVRIKEGDKERIQAFEGTVIAKKHGGIAETFTVRRTSYGVGVERVFPVNSPFVEKVEVVRRGRSVVRSSSTCASAPARPPRSRHASEHTAKKGEDGWRSPFFRIFASKEGGSPWQCPLKTAINATKTF